MKTPASNQGISFIYFSKNFTFILNGGEGGRNKTDQNEGEEIRTEVSKMRRSYEATPQLHLHHRR